MEEFAVTVGRNDPCPCGSGRKYKKCHLAADEAPRAAERSGTVSPLHDLDQRLVHDILELVVRRFPGELAEEVEILDSHPSMTPQFVAPWLAYVTHFEGRTAVEWFFEERAWSLSRGAVDWLAAQQESWLSIWEILEVEPGHHLVLRDLLTFRERTVHEVSGSRMTEPGFIVLGRIVDLGDVSTICGLHATPLRPARGSLVVEKIRKVLRRKGAVPPDRLRGLKVARRMLNEWSNAVALASTPPRLANSDGDPILLTTDRWQFDGRSRNAIAGRIASIQGAKQQESGTFVLLREEGWDITIIGGVRIDAGTISLETNSVSRAEALSARIEHACGELLGAHIRSHADPVAMLNERTSAPPASRRERTDEENSIVLEVKNRYYSRWTDEPVPALDGKTPREMVRTASGRRRVEKILQEIEMIENADAEDARVDVGGLRRELGIE